MFETAAEACVRLLVDQLPRWPQVARPLDPIRIFIGTTHVLVELGADDHVVFRIGIVQRQDASDEAVEAWVAPIRTDEAAAVMPSHVEGSRTPANPAAPPIVPEPPPSDLVHRSAFTGHSCDSRTEASVDHRKEQYDAAAAFIDRPPSDPVRSALQGDASLAGVRIVPVYWLQLDLDDRSSERLVEELDFHENVLVEPSDTHSLPAGYYNVFYERDAYSKTEDGEGHSTAQFTLQPLCERCVDPANVTLFRHLLRDYEAFMSLREPDDENGGDERHG